MGIWKISEKGQNLEVRLMWPFEAITPSDLFFPECLWKEHSAQEIESYAVPVGPGKKDFTTVEQVSNCVFFRVLGAL